MKQFINERRPSAALESQYEKQGSCCYYCKKDVPFKHITRDHFLPVSSGNNLVNNKVFACRKCNSLKGNMSIETFRSFLIRKIRHVLQTVVDRGWTITDEEVEKIQWYSALLKTTGEIIENDYKPKFLFT